MEPFSMMLMMGAGLAFQGAGMFESSEGSKEYNESKKREIALEQKVDEQRRIKMNLDASRMQMENLRNVQRARSQSLTAATSQGAAGSGSSGLQGAYGQIKAQGAWNSLGITQNLEIGNKVFDLNAQISQERIQQADANQKMQLGQGLSSFGSSLFGAGAAFGRLASGFGSPKAGGYNPSMTGANAYAGWA